MTTKQLTRKAVNCHHLQKQQLTTNTINNKTVIKNNELTTKITLARISTFTTTITTSWSTVNNQQLYTEFNKPTHVDNIYNPIGEKQHSPVADFLKKFLCLPGQKITNGDTIDRRPRLHLGLQFYLKSVRK